MIKNLFGTLGVTISGLIGFFFGDITLSLKVLAGIMALDLITGIIKVLVNGEKFSLKKAFIGGAKKLLVFAVVSLSHLVDLILPIEEAIAMFVVTGFYIGYEGLSVLNNVAQADVLVPSSLKKYLEKFKSDGEE